jgi:hypothetical protein
VASCRGRCGVRCRVAPCVEASSVWRHAEGAVECAVEWRHAAPGYSGPASSDPPLAIREAQASPLHAVEPARAWCIDR